MQVKMANLSKQVEEIQPDLNEGILRLLLEGSFIGGKEVRSFEEEFARYVGAEHAIGVANGTDALEVILQSLNLDSSSTVLVPANSFVATAEAVLNSGLRLKLVDVDHDFGFDLDLLLKAISPDVRVVIMVHLYGMPNDAPRIKKELDERGILLIEDCAQAHGAKLGGQHVGTFGVAGAFSFYPGKNLGALGDAGAIVTSDAGLAERMRRIGNHGRLSKFDHDILGRNSRLDNIQALALSLKLAKLDEWNSRRRRNASVYRSGLTGIGDLILPPEGRGESVYHHFVIRTAARDALRDHLRENGIETGLHYPESIDEMPPFAVSWSSPLGQSRALSRTILSLPVAEHLGLHEVDYVIQSIRDFFRADRAN